MPTQTKAREPNLVHYSKRTHKPHADVTAKVTLTEGRPGLYYRWEGRVFRLGDRDKMHTALDLELDELDEALRKAPVPR